jgi:tRNA (Thr-GGU) A37 N-methylase
VSDASTPISEVDNEFAMTPVGHVRGGRMAAIDDDWGGERAVIELDATRFDPDATLGLEEFSHVEVVFVFHLVDPEIVETGSRHPRGRQDWPRVGIFAQRARNRRNRLGLSRCRLLAVDGLRLTVEGLDAINGTPVLDVKPYMSEFAPRGDIRQPPWSHELMARYWNLGDA